MFQGKLIEEVKKHPILYKKSSGGYKNVAAKYRIWNDIAKKLDSTDETCQKTWKALRDRFCRENKKTNCPSGSAAPTEYLWEYWDLLYFLKEHVQPRRTRGNFSTSSAECTEEGSEYSSSTNIIEEPIELELNDVGEEAGSSTSNSQPTSIRKKTKINDFEEKFTDTMETFNTYLKSKTNSVPDPKQSSSQIFALAVSNILDTLSATKQKFVVKAQMLKLLSDAQLDDIDDIIEFDNI